MLVQGKPEVVATIRGVEIQAYFSGYDEVRTPRVQLWTPRSILQQVYPEDPDRPGCYSKTLRYYEPDPATSVDPRTATPGNLGVLTVEEDRELREVLARLRAELAAVAPPPADLYRALEGDRLYRLE